jgi:hypothetical protein
VYSARILGCIAAEYSASCEHVHFTNRLGYVNRYTDISMHTRCMPQTQESIDSCSNGVSVLTFGYTTDAEELKEHSQEPCCLVMHMQVGLHCLQLHIVVS